MVSPIIDPRSWLQYLLFFSVRDRSSAFASPSMRLLGKVKFFRSIVSVVWQSKGGTHESLLISLFLPGCYIFPYSLPFGLFLFCSFCYYKQALTEVFSVLRNEEISLSANYIKWPQIRTKRKWSYFPHMASFLKNLFLLIFGGISPKSNSPVWPSISAAYPTQIF